jgi:3-phenylpropionate/trans-cinnamate dioxygenase ferredoxin reductase subunit
MSEHARYLIIGAGLAGHFALRGIRERDADGRIVLIGDEPELPYTRPHLSKAFLMGTRPKEKVMIKPASYYEENRAEVWTGRKATRVDAAKKVVTLADGLTIGFDKLLLATGSDARRLQIDGGELRGVYTL